MQDNVPWHNVSYEDSAADGFATGKLVGRNDA